MAGIACTMPKIFVTTQPSPDTQSMEATQSLSSCGQTSCCHSPVGLDDAAAAPLLCAGIIGFRSLRMAGVQPGERVGLYGFGSSASLAIQVLHSWNCEVYVSSRGQGNRDRAAALGATWVGKDGDKPPVPLDRAITFAPSGEVVIAALGDLRKGGVVAVNAIHMDKNPGIRLRQPALGRATDTQRGQHDQSRCPQLL